MALTWAKELLGDAYTEELDKKLEAQITAEYAPKAELEQVKAQIADYKQRAEAAEKDRDEKLAAAAFAAKIEKALTDARAYNPKLAQGALDLETLRASKNQDADIAAAIAAAQKSDGYLFAPAQSGAEPAPAAGTGTGALPSGAKYSAEMLGMRKAAGLPVE